MSVSYSEIEEYYAEHREPKRRCHKLFPNCRTCDDVKCMRWCGDENEEEEGDEDDTV